MYILPILIVYSDCTRELFGAGVGVGQMDRSGVGAAGRSRGLILQWVGSITVTERNERERENKIQNHPSSLLKCWTTTTTLRVK